MSEKRFKSYALFKGKKTVYRDNEAYTNEEVAELLNDLKEENEQLRKELKEKEEDEQLYANEIVKLNKEAKEVLDFKSLGGDY